MTDLPRTCRFAVGSHDGPRSGVWRAWLPGGGKSDVYVAARHLGHICKVSLHETGDWRYAFSGEYLRKKAPDIPVGVQQRIIERWSRPKPIAAGVTIALRIHVPRSELRTAPSIIRPRASLHWIATPPEDHSVEIGFALTTPQITIDEWPGKRGMNTKLLWRAALPSGELLWVVEHINRLPEDFMKDVAAKRNHLVSQVPHRFDLATPGLRCIFFGTHPDGSRFLVDAAMPSKVAA